MSARKLINNPAHDLKTTQRTQKREDLQRSQSKSVLNLADVLHLPQTAAELALKEINDNQAVWANQITKNDLKKFAQKVQQLNRKLGKINGISPNAIIARSRDIDIRRAEREIHTVQAVKFHQDGTIQFRTNASIKHGATHHIVSVQFLAFQAALTSGTLTNKFLDDYLKSPIKFDCDCGRHRYWYRYIATVGGFAYGKPETAFPKIRNPELTGMACKHVIRVMHTLARKPFALRNAAKLHLERFRKDPNQVAKTLTKKQAKQTQFVAKNTQIRKSFKHLVQQVQEKVAQKLTPAVQRKALAQLKNLRDLGILTENEYQNKVKNLK